MKQPDLAASLWDGVSSELKSKLDHYGGLLQKWQAKINLVSNTTLAHAETRHFLDSLQLAAYIPQSAKVLYDIGSGAGFPGLVIAAARPEIAVHLIETDQKKCVFLQTVSREISTPVKVHTARAEKVVLPPPDVVTARALADLSDLLRLTERWWAASKDVVLVFPKGANARAEIEAAQKIYTFDVEIHVSITDADASILVLRHVEKCE
jgi:16S rRNA (guanine527-N7)-methyltransferase